MGWFERLMFGVVFPFVFCSIGGFFARQGYDQVKIWYDPNDPKSSYIDGYKEDTVSSVGCLILLS